MKELSNRRKSLHKNYPRRQRSQPRLLHENPFLKVTHTAVDFGAFAKDYYVVDFNRCAVVVGMDAGRVLMTWQYRNLIDDMSLELPGGTVDEGEAFEDAARREFLEETGHSCSALDHAVTIRPGLDNVENLTHIYFSDSVRREKDFVPDARESVALEWVPIETCVELVLDKKITDSASALGILARFARSKL